MGLSARRFYRPVLGGGRVLDERLWSGEGARVLGPSAWSVRQGRVAAVWALRGAGSCRRAEGDGFLL